MKTRPRQTNDPLPIPSRNRRRGRVLRIAPAVLILLSCAYFTFRGPVRAARRSVDFPVFYSASRAWALGSNPYDSDNINAIFREAGGPDQKVTLSLNPPLTFVLLSPITALPYTHAKYLLIGINIILTGAVLYGLASIAGFGIREPRTQLFLAFAIALAGFHTSISQGQLTIVVTACMVFALWCDLKSKDYLLGALLALAAALKPQMVVVFGFYYLFRLRWRVCVSAIIVGGALAAIAVARMELAHVPWLGSLMENMKTFTEGGTGDPTVSGAGRYIMINLHVLLHAFFADRLLVNILVIAFVGALGTCLLLATRKARGPRVNLLIYSALSVLTLLCTYHRIYSATLLVFPLIWAIDSYHGSFRRIALACMILIVPFLVPGVAVLNTFVKRGLIPEFVSGKWWWNFVVLPHQIYALILLAFCLVYATVIIARPLRRPPPG